MIRTTLASLFPQDPLPGSGAPSPEPGAAAAGEAEIPAFRAVLLAWFEAHRRELPWRETRDPYRILVSEIMLQQTRVETVVPYYLEWIRRFPDLESLARADEEEVLRAWQGLGYYRRARNLRLAALKVLEEHGGEVPEDATVLRRLPGVGEYTAGAVGSIAFGVPVPAVDGNVRRVLARLLDEGAPGAARLRAVASTLVDPDRPGDWNQALMELGATVCVPRSPACARCPVARWCTARAEGTVAERPARASAREVPRFLEAVAVMVRRGREPSPGGWEVLLERRPEGGLLGGMWGCPGVTFAGDGDGDEDAAAAARSLVRELLGEDAGAGEALPSVEHRFTHRAVTYLPFRYVLEDGGGTGDGGGEGARRWVPVAELDRLPIPRAQERILGDAEPAGGP
jgi:A/G-specific adenine glycosylase